MFPLNKNFSFDRKGFTLVELMISAAIVGVFLLLYLSAYHDYMVRAKMTEVILAATDAKLLITEAFITGGADGVAKASSDYSDRKTSERVSSRHIEDIFIDHANGVVTVVISKVAPGFPADAVGKTIVFTPFVKKKLIGSEEGLEGRVEWVCASESAKTAISRGFTDAVTGNFPPKYVPSECR